MVSRTTLSITIAAALATMAGARTVWAQAGAHTMTAPAEIKWGPAPPTLPASAQLAVLDGDPGKTGPFALRLKMPDGYKVAPHWHPTDESIVVLQGTFVLGMGDTLNAAAGKTLGVGGFAKMPKQMHHFAVTKGETIVQVYGDGPFVVNYVNPKDDPSKKPTR